jgi:molybdate transport system ATP-binding protein
MPQLSVDVRFRHQSGFALDVAFLAGEGVTAVVGPSGSGKSTILHLIAGVLLPKDGLIRLGQHTLVDTRSGINLPPEQRCIGMVFQDLLLFPHLTVRKNLLFGVRHKGSQLIRFEKVIEVLEIGDLLHRYPATLSGGQRQRVALGRALLRGPELLLLDEPLAALDDTLKERVLAYLRRVFQEWRIPALLVCHDREDVDKIAGTIIPIKSGHIETTSAR